MRLRRKPKPDSPALKAAKAERKHSDNLRSEAVALVRDLQEIRERNHFAASLRELVEGN